MTNKSFLGEAAWADIQFHLSGFTPFLRVMSFNEGRSAKYINDNRFKHDEVVDLELTAITPDMFCARYGLLLKFDATAFIEHLTIPGVAKLTDWRTGYKYGGDTFVASTFLNQCNYFVEKDAPAVQPVTTSSGMNPLELLKRLQQDAKPSVPPEEGETIAEYIRRRAAR